MKILLLATTFPRWENDQVPDFVEQQIIHLKLLYPNLKFTVLAPHHQGAEYYEKNDSYEIYRFKYMPMSSWQKLAYPAIMPNLNQNKALYLQMPFFLISIFFYCLFLTIKIRPNHIYAHWFMPSGITAGFISIFFRNIKFSYTSHSSDVEVMQKIPVLGSKIVKFFSNKANAITVVSNRSLKKLKYFFTEEEFMKIENKVKIIPMGVNINDFTASSSNLSRKKVKEELRIKSENVLFFIGRLVEKKGITYLLRAYKKIEDKFQDTLLIIAGNGPLEDELKKQAKQLKIENYIFPGFVSGNLKQRYFLTSDVCIIPSIISKDKDAEGLPVALLEALAAKKIVIATDVSGADDILTHKKNGFIIRQKNVNDIIKMYNEVRNLSEHQKDNLKNNAYQKAFDFNWSNIAKQHYNFLFKNK